MNLVKNNVPDQFSLMSTFDELRLKLASDDNRVSLTKPISHWARQGDRRLPYALLRFTVGELIGTPFTDLAATPGIGPKKIGSLLTLMQRALDDREPKPQVTAAANPRPVFRGEFDPDAISESMWEEWRATVRSRGLQQQMLGQLTPSLQDLPTVIWATELGEYLGYTLADLRALKTHGEKRVQVVLEVFFIVHTIFDGAGSHPRFVVSLRPGFVAPIEYWIRRELETDAIPEIQDLRENLTLPLLNQIQADGGQTVHQLACGRLGIESDPESVRCQADRFDVTRARIYQLLETCGDIMRVRWPEGRRQLAELAGKFADCDADDPRRVLFEATHWLMFPRRAEHRGVAHILSSESITERVSSRSSG